jgi:hypothetical protein
MTMTSTPPRQAIREAALTARFGWDREAGERPVSREEQDEIPPVAGRVRRLGEVRRRRSPGRAHTREAGARRLLAMYGADAALDQPRTAVRMASAIRSTPGSVASSSVRA